MWQVRIHGCVRYNVDPRQAFAAIDAHIPLNDFVRAEFEILMDILATYPAATRLSGAAITIEKVL